MKAGAAQAPGNSLSVIDLRAARERTRVDLGELRRPHGLAVQGQSVYFTAEDAQQVARYDAAGSRVDWRFSTGQQRSHLVLVTRVCRGGQRRQARHRGPQEAGTGWRDPHGTRTRRHGVGAVTRSTLSG
jgi:hypothetical protein